MSLDILKKQKLRIKRQMRNRKKLKGCAERPRLSVSKSLKHIGAQLIDDEAGCTLASFSTLSKEAKGRSKSKDSAKFIGKKIAEIAKEKNIKKVVFDRGRFKYHGLVANLAESARESGLVF
tara:strand:+ start:512 stop:874 length:363 start_codon:yes stop_codon:yes gene_type:complete